MSISSIQNNQYIPHQVTQAGNKNQLTAASDGDNDRGVEKSQRGLHGTLGNTIQQTLSQLGLGQANQNSAVPQALQSFIQNLFAAIQTQQGTNTSLQAADSDGDNDGSGTASSTEGHNGRSELQAGIQNLIQQLATSSNTSGNSSSVSSLQQSFQNLLSSEAGGTTSTSQPTLSSFLQSLSQNLQGSGSVGNLVNTKS